MREPVVRAFLVGAGFVCVAIGAIALLVPVLPTTPFLLVAAACFAKSSPRFYRWLLDHRWFGPFIRNYRERGGITKRQKTVALATFWPAVLVSAFFMPVPVWALWILGVCAVGVTAYLLFLKTVPEDAH